MEGSLFGHLMNGYECSEWRFSASNGPQFELKGLGKPVGGQEPRNILIQRADKYLIDTQCNGVIKSLSKFAMKVLRTLPARFRNFFMRKYPLVGQAGLIGVVCVVVGASAGSTKLQSFFLGTGSSLIAAAIYSFVNYVVQEPYQQFATLGITGVYAFRTKVDQADWCVWLSRVKKHCVLFGIANHNWCEDANFPGAVQEVVHRKLEVIVFFLNPNSPIAEIRREEEWRTKGRNTVQITRDSIRYMWGLKQRLDPADREFFRLFVYEGTPSGTNWFDDFMIVTHYLAGTANVNSPALRLESTGGAADLFDIYKKNIEEVRKHCSIEITEENVGKYT